MVIYSQDGHLTIGAVVFTAYSGNGAGLNNPNMEGMADYGPIPRGLWKVAAWYDRYEGKGPIVARLEPVGHDAHGRNGFLCHGDSQAMNHTASHGCIVAPRDAREAWRKSGDMDLTVE